MDRRQFCQSFLTVVTGMSMIGCENIEKTTMSLLEKLMIAIRIADSRAYLKYMPPPLSIDEIGWREFLLRWGREATELSRTITFRYGIAGYTEEFAKDLEQELGVSVPPELYRGGLEYPPKSEKGKRRTEEVLSQIKKMFVASVTKHEGGNTSYGIWSILNEYAFATLQGDKQMFPPAGSGDIEVTEQRLGIVLPPSYKGFLSVSNGFWVAPNCRLLPIQKIGWAGDMDEFYEVYITEAERRKNDFCDVDSYYRYGKTGLTEGDDDGLARCAYKLSNALLLTDPNSTDGLDVQIGILPFERDIDIPGIRKDEWEAFWHLAPRAISFKHLMEYLYRYNIAQDRKHLARG